MRLRKKKNLAERLLAVKNLIIAGEGYGFYDLPAEKRTNILDLAKEFQNSNPVVLDIGCGRGGFVCEMALRNPNLNFIAVERLSNVIIEACETAVKMQLPNLRFFNCGAENLLYFLSRKSVSRIYLNFSCPYPKKAYANRRLTSQKFLKIFDALLAPDGVIFQKTDNLPFFLYSIEEYREYGFVLFDETRDLLNSRDYAGNVMTEYERKFTAMNLPIYAVKAAREKSC